MPRPDKTFLVEAGRASFRVDLRRAADGYSLLRVLRGGAEPDREHGGIDDFLPGEAPDTGAAEWIGELLKLRPRPAREVTVLSDRVTAVVADIPGVDAGGDWRSGAEMEAQTVSGLSSGESLFAVARLPSEAGLARCWAVQASLRDVAALRSAVAAAGGGCRLAAAGHPAGIRLDPAVAQLESWSGFSLFHGTGRERLDLRGWNGPDALAEALEDGEVAVALDGIPAEPASGSFSLLRGGPDAALPDSPETDVAVTDLGEAAGAEAWAARLAKACDPLTGRVLGMPMVAVPKLPPSPARLAGAATAIAAAVALLLGGHYWLTERQQRSLEAELERLKAPAERLAETNRRIADLRKELAEAKKAEQEMPTGSDLDVFAHRKRIGSLLEGLAVGAEVREAVVLNVVPGGLDTMVSGAATTFNAPQELAGRIDETLSARGWRAALVRRTAKLLQPDGGPWSFDIRLTPGRPVALEDSPATAGEEAADTESEDSPNTSAAISF